VGRTIQINGEPVRIVGIMPARFRLFGEDRDVWSLLTPDETWREPSGRGMHVAARLAPDATLAEANAEMDVIATALERQWSELNAGWRVSVVDARADLVGDVGQPLTLLLVAVALVLLVGCANAANLLLARAAERRREFEVRTALGATRSRLVSQLVLEGLVLGGLGTIAGLALAHVALGAMANIAGTAFGVPRLENAALNLPVLAVALGLLLLCTLAFGLVPGWLAGRATGNPMLTGTARVWTGGPVERRVRTGLVIAQVAFAVLLVVSAALVGRSLARLVSVDPGFDPTNVLTFAVSLPGATYSHEQQVAFFERAAESLRALPGVADVGAISWIPFGGPGAGTSYDVDGRVPLAAADRPVADIRPVDAAYFDVMRIPVKQGRAFTPDEVRSGARVTVVNETLVRLMFPDENPIGKRLQVNWNDGLDEIVGVVGDVKISSLDADGRSQIYFPQGTANVGFVTYVMRTTVEDEMSLGRQAEATIQAFDPDLPVRNVKPMQALVDDSVAASRVSTWLVAAFGGLALLLALVGVAGLQAAAVAARLPEFGIRLALGATSGRIRRLVLGQAGWLIGVGLVLGLAAAVAASRLLTGLLYDVPATDPLTFAGVATSIAALGLVASLLSTRRATRVDPADTLRG
jgi:putative ABC transport system permease protein